MDWFWEGIYILYTPPPVATPLEPTPHTLSVVGNSTIQACVQFFEGSFLPAISEEDEDVDDALLPDTSQSSPVDEISTANSEADGPSLIVDNSVPAYVRPCCDSVLTTKNY